MAVDPETEEPILHIAGYIIREEVEKALKTNHEDSEELPLRH
jgi:hypothetical protein